MKDGRRQATDGGRQKARPTLRLPSAVCRLPSIVHRPQSAIRACLLTVLWALGCSLGAPSARAQAEPPAPAGPLTLPEAIRSARTQRPLLESDEARLGAARARVTQARSARL